LSGFQPRAPYGVAGRPALPISQRPLASFLVVSDDYFKVLEIPFREGRTFNATDLVNGPGVCIVNETLAKHVFPGESALGKFLLRGPNGDLRQEIVGVIADVKSNGLNAPAPEEVYYSARQVGRAGMAVVAKIDGDAAALQAIIKAAVTGADKDQPISFFATLESNLAQSLGTQRIVASLTAIFAAIALVLAAV